MHGHMQITVQTLQVLCEKSLCETSACFSRSFFLLSLVTFDSHLTSRDATGHGLLGLISRSGYCCSILSYMVRSDVVVERLGCVGTSVFSLSSELLLRELSLSESKL